MDVLSEVKSKIKNKSYSLKENSAGESEVWNGFYVVLDDGGHETEFVQCKIGQCVLRMSSASTLATHNCTPSSSPSSSCVIPTSAKRKITEACLKMCAIDLHPLGVVSATGFKMVAQELINVGNDFGRVDACKVLPNPATVSRRCLEVADAIRRSIIPEILDAMQGYCCAATAKLWANYKKNHLVSLTVHYMSEWTVKHRVLLTCIFPKTQQFGETIKKELTDQFAALGIQLPDLRKVAFVTADCVKNSTVQQVFTPVPCAGYCLSIVLWHTFLDDFLNSQAQIVRYIFQETPKVVSYFKRTGLATLLKHPLYDLANTGCNHMLMMLKSVHDQYDKMLEVLSTATHHNKEEMENMEHKLKAVNKELMSDIIQFLEPFNKAMDDLDGNTSPTIQNVLLWFYDLVSHCGPASDDKAPLKKIKARALQFVKDKMEIHPYHKMATFLSPWFCQLRMMSTSEKEVVLNEVRDMCKLLDEETREEQSCSGEPPKQGSRFQRWKNELKENAEDEVLLYMAAAQKDPGEENDVLGWWKTHAQDFPRLSRVVKRLFCIPATSEISLRHRRRIPVADEHAKELLFLHGNIQKLHTSTSKGGKSKKRKQMCNPLVFEERNSEDSISERQEQVPVEPVFVDVNEEIIDPVDCSSGRQEHVSVQHMLVDIKEEIVDLEDSDASFFIQPAKRPKLQDYNDVEQQQQGLVNPCRVCTKVERDRYDVLAEQIADDFRHLQCEFARDTVEHLISDILYEAKLGKYDEPQAGTSSSLLS